MWIHRREQECFLLLCMIFHNLWNSSGITATQIGNIIQTVKLFHASFNRFFSLLFPLFLLFIKITISSIAIGLKNSYFAQISWQVIGQFVNGQFLIGQLNKPIIFKVVV